MIGFGFGAVIGLSYWYNKNVRNKMVPIANVDSENKLLFLEPPPVDFIAKKVFEEKCYIISDCFVFFFSFVKYFSAGRGQQRYQQLATDIISI